MTVVKPQPCVHCCCPPNMDSSVCERCLKWGTTSFHMGSGAGLCKQQPRSVKQVLLLVAIRGNKACQAVESSGTVCEASCGCWA